MFTGINVYVFETKPCSRELIFVVISGQGWTLSIVRLPGTTESNCRTTELPNPLVRQDK